MAEEYKKWEYQVDDKSKSAEIKLNKKEIDMEKMERLLIEMHKKMDGINMEKAKYEDEVRALSKSNSQ